jgi:hypothetical protein
LFDVYSPLYDVNAINNFNLNTNEVNNLLVLRPKLDSGADYNAMSHTNRLIEIQ